MYLLLIMVFKILVDIISFDNTFSRIKGVPTVRQLSNVTDQVSVD